MILSDQDIEKYIQQGKIKISPTPDFEKQLGPASLDLRLGSEFKVFNHSMRSHIDPRDHRTFEGLTKMIKIQDDQPFILHPKEFVLAATLEKVSLGADIGARIEGRSSWGRLGLIVHSTAGYVDPGFSGRLTLEMTNIGPISILLYDKTRICQLAFETLSSPAKVPYSQRKGSKYISDMLPQESRLYDDE
ncbi:MAG: dCTP deaminase [Patescibacteria group bacterium]|nr:dCTP deaminase [Patescibacteria group bacterium]